MPRADHEMLSSSESPVPSEGVPGQAQPHCLLWILVACTQETRETQMGSRSSHWDSSGVPWFPQSAGQFQLLHKPELSHCQAIQFHSH